ncbi:aldo/keto reductase [Jeotgalibacillus campisalis]|uniref:Oxidoreductase n=1 Tax=Jeotgalibacillus campisalis TaxID=220754 RepID=A0A0C2VD10_9BACL|nr:aldo/keto reductase family oxidoreductase [Jeotgalibacillus campisalis]KIL46837.1 oxidoreductase [Jeotgalibacillus campisalis]
MERITAAEDLQLSRIIHGMMRLTEWNLSKEERLSFIKEVMEKEITTFDHADIYGSYQCEELFGEALALDPSIRKKMEIITKCGIVLPSSNRPAHKGHYYDTSKKHIIKSVEQSLQNLHTDYIDLLLIHRPDPFMNPEETAEAFDQLHNEGKVLHFGVSNFKRSQLKMLESYTAQPLVTNQIELNPYNLENFEDGTLDLSLEMQAPPMAWSPLAGGQLFGNEEEKAQRIRTALKQVGEEIGTEKLDEVMYAWLFSHPASIMPIVGSGKIERIDAAIKALTKKLTPHQWYVIYEASLGHEVP